MQLRLRGEEADCLAAAERLAATTASGARAVPARTEDVTHCHHQRWVLATTIATTGISKHRQDRPEGGRR
jgi:hypothetical protein